MTPSDEDLDSLLTTWTAPPSPDSLERRVRLAYRERVRVRTAVAPAQTRNARAANSIRALLSHWIARSLPIAGKFAAIAAGAVVLLAVIARAVPQSLYFPIPPGAFVVDAEFRDYRDDGSYTIAKYQTSFFQRETVKGDMVDGGETVLSSSFPGDPLRTAARNLLDPMWNVLGAYAHRIVDPWFYKPGRAAYLRAREKGQTDWIRNGCTLTNVWHGPVTVIGKESVLNYATTVSRFTPASGTARFTEWIAPQLDCFSLRSTTEEARPGGAFRLVSERRVLKVERSPIVGSR